MGSLIARSLRKQDILRGISHGNTFVLLATRAPPNALGALTRAFGLARRRRPLVDRRSEQEVRRELGVGLNDPDQHLAIFGATTLGFKAPYQGQGRFRAQMNFSEIVEKFEASKHDGLHSARS